MNKTEEATAAAPPERLSMNLRLDDVATSSPAFTIDKAELWPPGGGETKPLATEMAVASRDRRQHLMVAQPLLPIVLLTTPMRGVSLLY